MQATKAAEDNVSDPSALDNEKRQTAKTERTGPLRVNRFRWYRNPDSIAADSFFFC